MVVKYAHRLTESFIKHNILKESDREIYHYCFELILSLGMNLLSILVLAAFTDTMLETLLYILGFWPIRVLAGGYHAKTQGRCYAMTMTFYLLFLFSLQVISGKEMLAAVAGAVLSVVIVFALAPIESENKPLDQLQQKVLKRKSRIASSIIALVVLCGIPFVNTGYCYSLSLGLTVAAVSLLLANLTGKLKRRLKG